MCHAQLNAAYCSAVLRRKLTDLRMLNDATLIPN
jgi:hypothetical protein